MEMEEERLKRLFTKCEQRFKGTPFKVPEGAKEMEIQVYRACRSGKCNKESFLPTFEQQNNVYKENDDKEDPGVYSLSVYENPKHIKRFVMLDSDMHIPYKIAKGETKRQYGLVQRTKDRKPKSKSHIDWWLFEGADPSSEFRIIEDFEKYLEEYDNNVV